MQADATVVLGPVHAGELSPRHDRHRVRPRCECLVPACRRVVVGDGEDVYPRGCGGCYELSGGIGTVGGATVRVQVDDHPTDHAGPTWPRSGSCPGDVGNRMVADKAEEESCSSLLPTTTTQSGAS